MNFRRWIEILLVLLSLLGLAGCSGLPERIVAAAEATLAASGHVDIEAANLAEGSGTEQNSLRVDGAFDGMLIGIPIKVGGSFGVGVSHASDIREPLSNRITLKVSGAVDASSSASGEIGGGP